MTPKRTLLIAAACVVLLAACQKEADQSPGPSPGPAPTPESGSNRVKTYTETITSSTLGNSSTTFNVSYDNSGRIASLVSAASPGDKLVYAFPGANSYTLDLFNAGVLTIHENIYLNAEAAMDSTFQYNNTADSSTEKYVYNTNKQLIKLREYSYSKLTGGVLDKTTTYTYDANGNVIKTQDSDGEAELFEYYPDLSYAPPFAPGPITDVTTRKMNLIKKHTTTSNGSLVETDERTYTFDAKNRISTEKQVLDDGTIAVKTYTYF